MTCKRYHGSLFERKNDPGFQSVGCGAEQPTQDTYFWPSTAVITLPVQSTIVHCSSRKATDQLMCSCPALGDVWGLLKPGFSPFVSLSSLFTPLVLLVLENWAAPQQATSISLLCRRYHHWPRPTVTGCTLCLHSVSLNVAAASHTQKCSGEAFTTFDSASAYYMQFPGIGGKR